MNKISRRRFLEGTASSAFLASALQVRSGKGMKTSGNTLSTGSSCGKSGKVFSGALWWLASDVSVAGHADLKREIADQKNAGFDLLWLCGTKYVLTPVLEGKIEDPFPILLREAERLGMRVMVETYKSSKWWENPDWETEKRENDILIGEVLDRYGKFPAFWGWYVGYETHHAEGELAKSYKSLLTHIRARCAKESPGKPVMLSPFFLLDREGLLGFKWIPPKEFRRFWTEVLKDSEIDILALQDSGEHLSCYEVEARRPFLEAGKEACDTAGARFWGNVETGELKVDGVKEYSKIRHQLDFGGTGNLWRRVPLEKLKRKVALAEEFSEELVTWGYTEYWRPSKGEEARKYYEAYVDWVRNRKPPAKG